VQLTFKPVFIHLSYFLSLRGAPIIKEVFIGNYLNLNGINSGI